ncbi:hypothetical protein JXA59_02285 [Patescibacteria group bacterium]|nr:hypothetical protein [Patescibacteria group bacterium]
MGKFDHKKAHRWVKISQVVFAVLILVFIFIAVLYGNNPSLAGSGSGGSALSFPDLIVALRNGMSVLIGALAVIMTIAGGVVYAVSQGNPNQMAVGRDLIVSAISGLALYAFSLYLLGNPGTGGAGGLIAKYFGGW